MRLIAVALALTLAAPAQAVARIQTIAPPGNAGVGQYLETVPTAGGGRPTNTVHPVGGGARGSGGSGGPGATPGSGGRTAIASSTKRALAALGPDGVAAAALAAATAPVGRSVPAQAPGTAPRSSVSAASAGRVPTPATSVFKVLIGSTIAGGLGLLLPIVLIGSALAAAVLVLLRRRPTS
jgi:hypothetical protein